jgi:O-antigen/teichoic acid export membrane protein
VQTSDIHNEYETGHYIALRLITFVAAAVFCIVYCSFTVAGDMLAAVYVYLLFKAGESFTDVLHGIYQLNDRFDYIAASQTCRGILTIVPFSIALLMCHNLIIALVAMTVCTIAYTIVIDIRLSSRLSCIRPTIGIEELKSLITRCAPGFAGLLFCTLTVSLVRQEYAIAYGADLMGIYAAIAAPAVIVQAAATFIYTPLFGPIAIAATQRDTRALKLVIAKFAVALIALLVICTAAFYLFGEPVFRAIYGDTVIDYLYIMYALLICTAITAFVNFLLDYLIILKSRFSCIIANLAGLIIAAIIWQPLCAMLGMNGINYAISIGYSVNAIIAIISIFAAIKRLHTAKRD